MEAIQVIDSTHLVPLPNGRAIMVGSPPEALRVLLLREYPSPSTVILPPDPLYVDGLNQASFEFLLFNHMFRMNGLRGRVPFTIVCDPDQQPRVERLIRHMLRGPSDPEMAEWRTPANHRRQLLHETTVVSGEVSKLRLDQMAQVVAFDGGRVTLPDGTLLESLNGGEVRVTVNGDSVTVPRRAQRRAQLPLYFADVERPVVGPRFGLQIIGSASGFSGGEWGSCFIIWINGQPLLIDGTPYLDEHLLRLGIADDHILGYLITHNHEDHANTIGQLVGRRQVTVLTSGPVMAGLVHRLVALLAIGEEEVKQLLRWVPLHPGLEGFGDPLHWFGAEIRTWYSVHTVPTLGVDIAMEGKHIRMPGDTLWGRQLEPLLEQKVISPARYQFILHTYDGADVIVADAGGGPIHPDPQEVLELLPDSRDCQLLVTHIPEAARALLPVAAPGTAISLIPREERSPEEAMSLFSSPLLRAVPERWLLALLYGGRVEDPTEAPHPPGEGALFVLAGNLSIRDGGESRYSLQRGDIFHPSLTPELRRPEYVSSARWTRLLRVPEDLFRAFLLDAGTEHALLRLYRTRQWWRPILGEELGLDTLVDLAELCRERRFRAGQKIVRQGEPASHFYIVTEGEVEVLREHDHKVDRVGVFGPSYCFGEIALLGYEVRRTATIRTRTETQVLELPARAFRRHLMQIPVARYQLSRLAAQRRAELERLAHPKEAAP